jgi:hypothetical protein
MNVRTVQPRRDAVKAADAASHGIHGTVAARQRLVAWNAPAFIKASWWHNDPVTHACLLRVVGDLTL